MTVQIYRYALETVTEPVRDSWSIVFMDSTGAVAVLSDYGQWSMRWQTCHTGKADFREFFVGCDASYVARKFARGNELREPDPDAREREMLAEIVRLRRRGEYLKDRRGRTVPFCRDWARAEWNLVKRTDWEDEASMQRWLTDTDLPDAQEYLMGGMPTRMNAQLEHWVTVSLPRLQQLIRRDLAEPRPEVFVRAGDAQGSNAGGGDVMFATTGGRGGANGSGGQFG